MYFVVAHQQSQPDPDELRHHQDHLVPLKEAWVSGARLWTTARRQAFANDLTRPQLIAVTDNVNQAKGAPTPCCTGLE